MVRKDRNNAIKGLVLCFAFVLVYSVPGMATAQIIGACLNPGGQLSKVTVGEIPQCPGDTVPISWSSLVDPPPSEVTVDCNAGETISGVLARGSNAIPITITVVGTCTEEVAVARDDVTIQGSTVDGTGEPVDTLIGGIDVLTSDRVTVKDLILRDGNDTGVQARRGASVTIDNLTISGFPTAGIGVIRHSFARIDGTDVNNPSNGFNAVFINDGSTARITNSHFVSQNGDQFSPALGIFRISHARLDGGNTIENTNTDPDPTKAEAINILDTSNLRIQGSGNVVIGNVVLESNSAADFRDLTINGQLELVRQVETTLSENTTVNGNVTVLDQSLLTAQSPGSVVTGTVSCSNGSLVLGDATAGFVCP